MLNTDEKMERKSTRRAGQDQRLEDMLNTDENIERKEYTKSRTGAETGRYVEHG